MLAGTVSGALDVTAVVPMALAVKILNAHPESYRGRDAGR
jgi:hypothetical protein